MPNPLFKLDLYKLLGVEIEDDQGKIKRAYRKKALSLHPDKNPDNAQAAEKFDQLTKAFEILVNESSRKHYDKLLDARRKTELRNQQMESKRQKMKESLEAREIAAELEKCNNQTMSTVEILENEINRIRAEGSKLLTEEQDYIRDNLLKSQRTPSNKLKIRWSVSKNDCSNGGYSQDVLNKIMSVFGEINALIISSRKMGSALVEFNNETDAMNAFSYAKGLPDNPIFLSWVGNPPARNSMNFDFTSTQLNDSFNSFEDEVLKNLRRAQKIKTVVNEIGNSDNGE